MDSLYSSYISDKESESDMELTNTDENSSEADANCEPVKMDLSEGSSENENERKDVKTDKQSSRSSSNNSDKLDEKYSKKYDENSREKYRSKKNDSEKLRDDERTLKSNDRRDREGRRERDIDRRQHDRKHSRRSRSRNSHRSSKSSRRSKSRSRSHSRKRSPSTRSHHRNHPSSSHRYHRHHSPSSYKSSRRSRSRSYDRYAHSRGGYEKRGVTKLHALEKMGIELKVPEVSIMSGNMLSAAAAGLTKPQTLTPQLALQKTMEEQVEKVKSATGIALPSYYNPIAVNASKYAEQIQKRRLLWGNKDKMVPEEAPAVETTPVPAPQLPTNKGTIWQGATFGGDQGSKVTAKFKRLMGMKEMERDGNSEKSTESTPDIIKKQEELFTSMESQYEVARLATHSHRGLGLGFGTFQPR